MKIQLHNIQDVYKSEEISMETMETMGEYILIGTMMVAPGIEKRYMDILPSREFEAVLQKLIKTYGSIYTTTIHKIPMEKLWNYQIAIWYKPAPKPLWLALFEATVGNAIAFVVVVLSMLYAPIYYFLHRKKDDENKKV